MKKPEGYEKKRERERESDRDPIEIGGKRVMDNGQNDKMTK